MIVYSGVGLEDILEVFAVLLESGAVDLENCIPNADDNVSVLVPECVVWLPHDKCICGSWLDLLADNAGQRVLQVVTA